MKRSAITRIITYSLTAVILAVVMGVVIRSEGDVFSGFFINISDEGGAEYNTAQSEVTLEQKISRLEIVWINGNVEINSGQELSFGESSSAGIADNGRMVYSVEGEKLTIKSHKTFKRISFSGVSGRSDAKTLKLTLPEELAEIEIQVVSADISLSGITAGSVDIEGVSGDSSLTDCTVGSFDYETVSGELTFDSVITEKGDFSTVSGNIEMLLPAESSFTAELDSVSGKLTTDFQCSSRGDVYTCGSGGPEFDFESVSGGITINQKQN